MSVDEMMGGAREGGRRGAHREMHNTHTPRVRAAGLFRFVFRFFSFLFPFFFVGADFWMRDEKNQQERGRENAAPNK
jgi:hypothetical protein